MGVGRRLALVKKCGVHATGNGFEDADTYGYRLGDAKLYPEAEAQLKQVVAKWPKNNYASYAQNLLGRAYLDEDKPSLAAVAFYNNYKDRPNGARAPHSLMRSEEHTSELQSLMRISYAVFCLKKKKTEHNYNTDKIKRQKQNH